MMNFRQEQLIKDLFHALKEKFSEIEFVSVTESPEDPNDLWLNVTAPEDEDREIELIKLAGDKTTDILIKYGYDICVMTINSNSDSTKYKSQEINSFQISQPV